MRNHIQAGERSLSEKEKFWDTRQAKEWPKTTFEERVDGRIQKGSSTFHVGINEGREHTLHWRRPIDFVDDDEPLLKETEVKGSSAPSGTM